MRFGGLIAGFVSGLAKSFLPASGAGLSLCRIAKFAPSYRAKHFCLCAARAFSPVFFARTFFARRRFLLFLFCQVQVCHAIGRTRTRGSLFCSAIRRVRLSAAFWSFSVASLSCHRLLGGLQVVTSGPDAGYRCSRLWLA